MKKILNISIILISLLFFTGTVFALPDADRDDYYDINTCSDLQAIDQNLNLNYELIKNIDCSGTNITPIGVDLSQFNGNFNGNGHTISDLNISSTATCVGLFAYARNADISNITLDTLTVEANSVDGYAGGLVGCSTNTTLKGISVFGEINCNGDNQYCAGIIGNLSNGDSNQLRFIGTITSNNSGNIVSVGGLIGKLDSNPSFIISESYFQGDIISNKNNVGGLVGYVNTGELDIQNSYFNGDITINNQNGIIGGLAYSEGAVITINNSYSTGDFNNQWMMGGLNYSLSPAAINNSFTTANFPGHLRYIINCGNNPTMIVNNWWYNTNADQNYIDVNAETGNGEGINKATSNSDFYDSDFNVYTGIDDQWNFSTIWLDGSSYPTLRWTVDTDADGILDYIDNVEGDEGDVVDTGVSNLRIVIGENGTTSDNYFGLQNIKFYDGTTQLFSFDYNFDGLELSLSKIKIIKNAKYLLVNLNEQLQANYTKTMYLTNSSFITLCLEDAEINTISEISSGCNGDNEYNIFSCLSGTYTIGEIVCDYNSTSKLITITGLKNSAIRGTVKSSPGGGGGGGGDDDEDVPDTNTPDTNTLDTNNTPDTNISQPPVYVDIINIETEDKPFIEQSVVVDLNTDTNTTTDITEPSLVDKAIEFVTSKVFLYIAIGLVAFIIFVIVVVVISKRRSRKPKEEPKAKPKEEPKKELPKSILVQIRKPEAQKPKEEPKAKPKEEPKSKSKRSEDLSIDDYLKKQDELKIADFLKRDSKK